MAKSTLQPTRLSGERWRRLPFDVGPCEWHFAASDALVRRATAPTAWAHASDKPTLILGAGQRAFEAPAGMDSTVRVVRRHAGGTAVFATPDVLGLDVALPASHVLAHPDVVEAYRWIGEVWLHAMQSLGVHARLATITEARSQPRDERDVEEVLRLACFGSLSPYEITLGGRKLVGLAQVRRRHTVLWQSGLHLHFDAEGLASLLPSGDTDTVAGRLRARAAGLDEVSTTTHTLADVARTFERSLVTLLGIDLVPGNWTTAELARTGLGG